MWDCLVLYLISVPESCSPSVPFCISLVLHVWWVPTRCIHGAGTDQWPRASFLHPNMLGTVGLLQPQGVCSGEGRRVVTGQEGPTTAPEELTFLQETPVWSPSMAYWQSYFSGHLLGCKWNMYSAGRGRQGFWSCAHWFEYMNCYLEQGKSVGLELGPSLYLVLWASCPQPCSPSNFCKCHWKDTLLSCIWGNKLLLFYLAKLK